jgi:hypothetical protein
MRFSGMGEIMNLLHEARLMFLMLHDGLVVLEHGLVVSVELLMESPYALP